MSKPGKQKRQKKQKDREREKRQRKLTTVPPRSAGSTPGQTIRREITQTEFRGPLPSPETLEHYERIMPGAAERIFSRFEEQTRHRHELERKIVEDQIEDGRRARTERRVGQILGGLCAIVALVGATHCAVNGAEWAASIIGGSTVVGLVSVFVVGRVWKAGLNNGENLEGD